MASYGVSTLEIHMTKEEYFHACKHFDWYYDYSDDHRVWKNGNARKAQLLAEAKDDLVKMQIFNDWSKYIFSNRETIPQPELENYSESN